jgi:hypothetical protein
MNPLQNEQSAGMPSWYDPFQEIRTMPKGWDLSSLLDPHPALAKSIGVTPDQDDQKNVKVNHPNLP